MLTTDLGFHLGPVFTYLLGGATVGIYKQQRLMEHIGIGLDIEPYGNWMIGAEVAGSKTAMTAVVGVHIGRNF